MALSTANSKERLSLSFHRGFALYRSGVEAVLASALAGSSVSTNDVLENTTLGKSQAEAMPRYAERSGLLGEGKQPTLFGELVGENDPSLSRAATQWLMHFYLSSPYKYQPNYWNFLVSELHLKGRVVGSSELKNLVGEFAMEATGTTPSSDTLDVAVSAFVGTYSREDSLKPLDLLEAQGSGSYLVTEPTPISAGAFACILADYWQHEWNDRDTVLLNEVTQGPLARLLRAEGKLGELLRALEKRHLVSLQRRTSPFSVTRRWRDVSSVWRDQFYSE